MTKRESMSGEELGELLLQSIREMKRGEVARKTHVTPNEVVAARLKTGLSPSQFARALRVSTRTVRDWELGRRRPTGAAQTLIDIASRHPEVIAESLREMG